ncbi:hypothetical protein CCACVL1_02260, partial [Corchorus capsularis]
ASVNDTASAAKPVYVVESPAEQDAVQKIKLLPLNDERVAGTPCFISSNLKFIYQDRMSQCAFPAQMWAGSAEWGTVP